MRFTAIPSCESKTRGLTSLTIAGWVAMWKPMETYLYDWWPVRRRGKVFKKLSVMPVEVVHGKRP